VRRARPRVVEQSGEVSCGPFPDEAEDEVPARRSAG
jgi:hypothetical protein